MTRVGREGNMIRIVGDTTCNLTPEQVRRYRVQLAPISIQFENETFEEGKNIDRDTFYRKIDEMGIIPTTSQPSPARFAEHYREAAQAEDQVLTITITQKHSGTYDSAVLAKSMVPEADVEVFDSRSISLGTGWMMIEAARLAEEGASRPEILERLGQIRARCALYLTPATLKYLQMSGRVGRLQGALASLLNVKPIIKLEEGELEAGENVRTRKKALERVLDLTAEAVGLEAPVNLGVIHARAPEEAQFLLEEAKRRFNCAETLVADLVSSLAVHGGPGVVGLVAYPV
jgi:DegV family protein with EDD domain